MAETSMRTAPLPVGSFGRQAFGWWGMLTVVMTEGALFAYLLFSYYYFVVQYGHEWLPGLPGFIFSAPQSVAVILAAVAMRWSDRAAIANERQQQSIGVAACLVLGIIFIALEWLEWSSKPYGLSSSSYGSMFFIITGVHLAHVIAGCLMQLALLAWSLLGYFDSIRHVPISVMAMYWYFVAVAWLAIFFTIYGTPYLG
jgi:cytochrome c oxidase subunit III